VLAVSARSLQRQNTITYKIETTELFATNVYALYLDCPPTSHTNVVQIHPLPVCGHIGELQSFLGFFRLPFWLLLAHRLRR